MNRIIIRTALSVIIAAALAAAPCESFAQVRRSGSSNTSTQVNRSNSSSSKSSGTQVNRSNSSSSKSSGSQVNRSNSSSSKSGSSQVNRSSSSSKSGSSQVNRSNSSSSKSSSSQVNRSSSSSKSSGSQVNRSNSSSSKSSSSQVNRSGSSSSKSGSSQVNRSSSGSSSSSSVSRSTSGSSKTGSTVSRSSSGSSSTGSTTDSDSKTTSSGKVVRSVRSSGSNSSSSSSSTARSATSTSGSARVSSDGDDTQVDRSGNVARRNLSVTNKGLGSSNSSNAGQQERRTDGVQSGSYNRVNEPIQPALNSYGRGQMRMDDRRDLHRIPPKERDFMTYDHVGHFFKPEYHYFGYRVKELPPSYRQMRHWGRRYYYYDNVYYTPYGSYYRVCRPPFGVVVDMAVRDLTLATVRFAYYHNAYHDMALIDSNYRTIIQQNRTIAENNALIAKQNSQLALNSSRALSAYEIADALQLIQSYAGIDTDYYYEDGVFYTINRRGKYEVIVPPAGALVDQLPDDYDTIVLSGVEYYRVDDTVYRLTLVDGSPYLEVLGQLPASLAELYY